MKKSEFIKSLRNIIKESLNEAYIKNSKDVINNYTHHKSGDKEYINSEWGKWFLSQDRKSKEQIAFNLKSNKEFRYALLSNWYDYYKINNNNDISFKTFLNTNIKVYRGETSRDIKYGTANGFASYTSQIELANHFSKDGNGKIIELYIKPKDTYGMIDSVGGEVEILVPTNFSENFIKGKLDDYINSNMWVFDKLNDNEINKFINLEDNKKYELAIELLSMYIKKYRS